MTDEDRDEARASAFRDEWWWLHAVCAHDAFRRARASDPAFAEAARFVETEAADLSWPLLEFFRLVRNEALGAGWLSETLVDANVGSRRPGWGHMPGWDVTATLVGETSLLFRGWYAGLTERSAIRAPAFGFTGAIRDRDGDVLYLDLKRSHAPDQAAAVMTAVFEHHYWPDVTHQVRFTERQIAWARARIVLDLHPSAHRWECAVLSRRKGPCDCGPVVGGAGRARDSLPSLYNLFDNLFDKSRTT